MSEDAIRRKEQMKTWRKFITEEGNEMPWWSAYRWCKEGANTDPRGVLATFRKGLMDTLELLL